MKKGKHFKRTAFNLSAKSMVSLMLLLIAMLMPQGAWAENFISEIKIGANSNQNTAKGYLSGYTPIDKDLNYGNGSKSWYIYLGYKTDTDASKAITGIMIVSGAYLGDEYLEGGTKTLSYDGKTWYRSPAQGAADINKGAGGDDLTIFYTRDGNTVNGGKPLVSLSVAEETGLSGYTYAGLYKNGAFSANGSTNVGTDGAARYITYTTHTHSFNQYGICSCGLNHVPSGNGTSTSPYEVEYYTDLVYLGNLTRNGNNTFHAIQTKDIDCGGKNIVPMGGYYNFKNYYFKGTYDGGGHVIKNAKYVNNTEGYSQYIGIFGYLVSPAKVKNLGVVNSTLGGYARIGAVCGKADSGTTIDNCFALNNTITATYDTFAGICGQADMTITNCYSDNYIRYNALKTCTNCYSVTRASTENTVMQISVDDITSGRLCYLINKNKTDGTQVWYQKLGTGAEDYPRPKKDVSKTVYEIAILTCDGKNANGSYIYANDKNAKVVADHKYSTSFTTDKNATCLEAGSKSKHCSACTSKTEVTTIPALNHNMTTHAAKPATCTEDGNLLYYTCSQACCSGKYYKDNGAHTTNAYADIDATVRGMLSHSMIKHAATDPTCTKDGNYLYYTCSRSCCSGKYYKDDADHTTKAYASLDETVREMLNHSYGDAVWSWEDDGHSATCTRTCSHDANHKISASVTLENGITSALQVAPNCTTRGTTRYTATATVEGTQYSATKDVADIGISHIYATAERLINKLDWEVSDKENSISCNKTGIQFSYSYNTASQTIAIIPNKPITVSCDYQIVNAGGAEGYARIYVELLDQSQNVLDTQYLLDWSGSNYQMSSPETVSMDINTPANARYVRMTLGGRDQKGWYGYYGPKFSNMSIKVPTVEVLKEATCSEKGTKGFHCTRCGYEDITEEIATNDEHVFTNHTLTTSPIEDGLYAYACDYGCDAHNDAHVIKDFNGAGNHLELTKRGSTYSTTEDVIINDGASFASPVDFTAASVTYNRNIVMDDGKYSFIVPFDIPAEQAAELGKFYQYSKHEEGKVYFDDITKIDNADGIVRANTAYFFEPAKDITSITVENPTFGTTGNMADATNPSEPGLYGTYSQIDIPVGAYGYGNAGYFVKAGTGNTLRPFRAYLWLGSGASMAKALAFFGDYNDVTGINNIKSDTDIDMSKPIYNLSGQRIMTPKKGEIYIQNGKKVIKK